MRNPMWSRTALVAVVLLLAASCSSGTDETTTSGASGETTTTESDGEGTTTTETAADDPIVIGMPLALTGVISGYDLPYLAGAELAVKEINAADGVLGRELVIVTADTRSDLALIAGTAEELIAAESPDFIVPTLDYDFGGPSARVAEEQDPALISVGFAGDPRFGLTGIGPHTYNLFPAGGTESATVATFAWEQGWRAPFVLGDTSISYSTNATDTFVASWSVLGGADSIVEQDTFLNGDPSIAAQIANIQSVIDEVDFIYLGSYPPGGASAIKQIRDAGIELPIVSGNGFDGTFWLEEGQTVENFYAAVLGVTTLGEDPNPNRATFFENYFAEYGEVAPLGGQTVAGYSAIQAIARAIEIAGTTDTEAVKAALDSFDNEPLAIADVTWTSECHVNIGASMPIVSFTDGAEVLVAVVQADPAAIPESVC